MSITAETRRDAHAKVSAVNRSRVLGEILSAGRPLGATEIAKRLQLDVTSVRPRCTELKDSGQIAAVGRRRLRTGRSEATFAPVPYLNSINREVPCSAFVPDL